MDADYYPELPNGLLRSIRPAHRLDVAGGLFIMRGIINIVIGLVFVVGGLSGQLALRGTGSGGAIAVVGVLLIGLGAYRMIKSRE